MRHHKAGRQLGRTASHRKAMLANMSAALFEQKHIKTTEAKAKEAGRVTEKLITLAKKGTVHARRIALKSLRHRDVVNLLFDEIAPKFIDRPGGYTRVIKLGQRQGDGAQMAILELVDFDTVQKKKKEKDIHIQFQKNLKSKDKEEKLISLKEESAPKYGVYKRRY
jgi:large subunit ribosomal protein L17